MIPIMVGKIVNSLGLVKYPPGPPWGYDRP